MTINLCNTGAAPSVDLKPLENCKLADPPAPLAPAQSSAITTVICDLLRAPGQRISPIGTAQNCSAEVCWLLRANHDHPNLRPIEENDRASMFETAETVLRRE